MKLSALLVVAAACGGHHSAVSDPSAADFQCRGRSVSYMATLGGGAETGVQMDCKSSGPHLKRWRTDRSGKRDEDARAITPAEFEKVWTQVDGTGWQNLRDCTNGTLGKNDPVYTFDIKDDESSASFQCQTRQVPYPYQDITNPLDFAANTGQRDLGGDATDDKGAK